MKNKGRNSDFSFILHICEAWGKFRFKKKQKAQFLNKAPFLLKAPFNAVK